MSSIMKRSTSMAYSKRKQQPAAEQQPTAVMSILVWGVIVADITSLAYVHACMCLCRRTWVHMYAAWQLAALLRDA
jgi:hypothetical protein